MPNRKYLIFPIIFAAVLTPVFIVALLTYQPGSDCDECDCAAVPAAAAHSHGFGLASVVKDDLQLIFNVTPGAPLYEVVDGKLQVCGGLVEGDRADEMRHITVDVLDARLALGERLPVDVRLELREQSTGHVVVRAGAPAMYAPGHGYHFGDNFLVPSGGTYDWTVTVSPVQALRQEGAQDLWQQPVTWDGTFTIAEDGTIASDATPRAPMTLLLDMVEAGMHVSVNATAPVALYDVVADTSTALDVPANSHYFVVDVTDHSVNYEEKLPGAEVTLTFTRGGNTKTVPLNPVISPDYGFHYGANVPLADGTWTVTLEIGALNFWRHAGATISLGREPLRATFTFEAVQPTPGPQARLGAADAARQGQDAPR